MSNSLVINHNLCALNLIGQINLHQNALSKSIRRLSSGLRINSAADDAAGLCISQRMRGQIAALKQASRNAQDGISFVQTAEGSLEEVHDMLTRMEELTVQAANGTYSETDKKNIQEEIEGLKKAIDHIAGTTRFNGINVFKSSTSNAAINIIFAKPITTTYSKINFKIGEGDGEIITYDVPTLSTDSLGISSLNVLNNADPDCVKNAIEKVSTIRGHLGALQNRLEHTYNNLMNTVENLTAAESRIRDADMAKEMMEFSKNNMLVQVGMTLLAQANSMPNNVLQLLRS